jgi:2-polyprenyl-3-methyl-5-hydroxy-6-metoxy-1,4-benzoquinol methylase
MNTEIIETEWGWDNPVIQDILLSYYRDWLFNTPDMAGKMVDRILEISGITPPGEILDIGCGLGYHSMAFAESGFHVFAFDPGEKYLEGARDNSTGKKILSHCVK